MGFFEDQRKIRDALSRQIEVAGGVYSDPYNEIATIFSVSDPKQLGRVKVSYQDGTVSDWIYILNGSNTGTLSAQFIGSPCLVGKANGNSEDAFVLGFFNKSPEAATPGAPFQLAILSEQLDPNRSPASPGDRAMCCSKGQAGKIYVFDTEYYQVPRICLRVSSRQEGDGGIWVWVPLTSTPEKSIEKGVDPGVPEAQGTTPDPGRKIGIPECTRALEGQVRNFSEDRKFRNFQLKCDKDADGNYAWSPVSAPPVFTKSLLPPKCTEKIHGMEAIVDSGRDSELVVCLRYQGEMKWIHHRTREPIQFYKEDAPLTKTQFLESRKPIPALQQASPSSQDFIGAAASAVLGGLLGEAGFSPLGGGSPLLGALTGAGQSLPGTFDPSQALSSAALTALASNSGVPIAQITSQLSSALAAGGVIDPGLASAFAAAGGLGDAIAQGIRTNTLDQALAFSGQNAIQQAMMSLSPINRGVYTGYMSGGMLGAIDVATLLGASQLPPEIAQYVAPIVGAASSILSSQPNAINGVINSSIGVGGQSLQDATGGLVGIAGGSGFIPPGISSSALASMQGGALGPIAQSLGGFAGLPGVPSLGGIPGIPPMASTALDLVGLGAQFAGLLGPGGMGLQAFSAFTGLNPITSMLGGLGGLGGLFGGGGDCPCDPKCRKTSHWNDSDGNKLLEPCGNVVANSHSSYDPTGDPTNNNNNRVAESIGRAATLIGEELCIENPYDLTDMIDSIARLGEMADRIEHAKHADWPELWTELSYTFETIEKAFKKTDNNITGVESVERKLIDAQYRLIDKLMVGDGSFFSKTLISIVDTSKAIQDVYNFVLRLDATKKGGRVGVFSTDSLKIVFENITKIALLNSASKAEARFIQSNIVKPADKEWRKLAPGLDLLSLSDLILGAVPIDIPLNFSKCVTKRDKNEVLKNSLESKLNSPTPLAPEPVISAKLPSSVTDAQQTTPPTLSGGVGGGDTNNLTPSISEVLNQIKYNQERTRDGKAEC